MVVEPTGAEVRARSPEEIPFNQTQLGWLGKAVSCAQVASLQAFGEEAEKLPKIPGHLGTWTTSILEVQHPGYAGS